MSHNVKFPATGYLVAQGLFKDDPFTLIDVGCSGGIWNSWRAFGTSLRAYAVDPMLGEIEKLQAAETNPNVTYHPGYIGLPKDHPIVLSRGTKDTVGNNPWPRLSTAWAVELAAKATDDNDTKVRHNRWPETRLADPSTLMTLAEFVRKHQINNVDFIKLDIDGNDYYALLSCEELIEPHGVLGFMLEVNFCGTDSDTDHTFHNSDRFMRRHRFELLDLSIRRYSRRALPAPFALRMFAQTNWGAPLQGDAVYLKDLTHAEIKTAPRHFSHTKLLKAVAVCEIVGMPDCAAEILTTFHRELSQVVDVDKLLDLLTPEFNGRRLSYIEYLDQFAKNPESFYPASRGHQSKWARRLQQNFRQLSSRFN
jgi:FkbM family methyltransferase